MYLELLEGEARQLFPEEEEELSKQTKLKAPNAMMLVFMYECEVWAV